MKADRAYYSYLVGKVHNVENEYNPKAEEYLSKAVKLNPNLIDAWNQLGDSYFKKGNYSESKNCFTNAVHKVSIVLMVGGIRKFWNASFILKSILT